MDIIIKYKQEKYIIFRLSKRNREGGFTGRLNLVHTNPKVKDWHFTYPSDGHFHYTIETQEGLRITFFQDKIIEQMQDYKKEYQGRERANELKKLAAQDLVPFGVEGNRPSLFEIVNGQIFKIIYFHIGRQALHLFPRHPKNKKISKKDLYFDIDRYKNNQIYLEIFMSMKGISNAVGVKCLVEKQLDNFLPIVKARIVKRG